MAEQSHLEAMREAIKGDLERARARRPSIFERPSPPPVEIRDTPPPMEQVELEPVPGPVVEEPAAEEPMAEDHVAESQPVGEPEPVAAADEPRKSFLRRLAFWR